MCPVFAKESKPHVPISEGFEQEIVDHGNDSKEFQTVFPEP
jgi:hypothetical protein